MERFRVGFRQHSQACRGLRACRYSSYDMLLFGDIALFTFLRFSRPSSAGDGRRAALSSAQHAATMLHRPWHGRRRVSPRRVPRPDGGLCMVTPNSGADHATRPRRSQHAGIILSGDGKMAANSAEKRVFSPKVGLSPGRAGTSRPKEFFSTTQKSSPPARWTLGKRGRLD